MITVPELAAEALSSFLASDMTRRFGTSHARLSELVPSLARLALECIGNSDALYHNVEHTMLVTLAGHDIMKGRALLVPTTPERHLERAAMDRKSLWQRVPCGVRSAPVRTGAGSRSVENRQPISRPWHLTVHLRRKARKQPTIRHLRRCAMDGASKSAPSYPTIGLDSLRPSLAPAHSRFTGASSK